MATSSSRNTGSRELRITARELRKWAPLLRLDAIRAGDVLLTRQRGFNRTGLESLCIAVATWGRYSHAGIFLPYKAEQDTLTHGTSRIRLQEAHLEFIEADDHGAGKLPLLRPLDIEFSGKKWRVAQLGGEVAAAVLLRHPGMKIDESTLERAASAFAASELLRSYSSWDRLVNPLHLPKPMKRILGRALRALERKSQHPKPQHPTLPGSFCSELVAKFFEPLDIRLLREARPPEKIAPKHLMPPRSYLEIVPKAFVTAADIPDDAIGKTYNIFQKDMRYVVGFLVRLRAIKELALPGWIKAAQNLDAEIEQSSAEFVRRDQIIRNTLGLRIHEQISREMSECSYPPWLRNRRDKLFRESTFLQLLRARLGREKIPRYDSLDAIDQALVELRLIHDKELQDLEWRLQRLKIICRLYILRQKQWPMAMKRLPKTQLLKAWRLLKEGGLRANAVSHDEVTPRSVQENNDVVHAQIEMILGDVAAETKIALNEYRIVEPSSGS